MKEYRIKRLYRNTIGWKWWLQRGEWHDTTGIMGQLMGPRKMFKVEFEEPCETKSEAIKRLQTILIWLPRSFK